MPFYACKLPHGLEIEKDGQTVVLVGANIGEELDNVSKNGSPRENRRRVYGFGLSELNDRQAAAFEAWKAEVTEGPNGGFPAFESGAILGPFKNAKDAEAECATLASAITTGMEGVDPEAEAKKKGPVVVKTRED